MDEELIEKIIRGVVVITFFVCAGLSYWCVTQKTDLQILAETGLKDDMIALYNKERAGLITAKTGLEKQRIELQALYLTKQQAEARLSIERVRLWADAYLYGAGGLLVSCCLAVVLLAGGYALAHVRRASVFVYKIGKHSEVPVRYKDMSDISPEGIAVLTQSEALRAKAPEEWLKLCAAVIEKTALKAHMATQVALPAPAGNEVIDIPRSVPTFRELLADGSIQRGKPMVFGRDTDTRSMFSGTWDDLFSCAVGGQQGSGKTSTLRSIVCQSLLQGYKIWVIDPHYPHHQSLLHSLKPFLQTGLIFEGTVIETLKEVNDAITRRLATKESSAVPAILVVDEVLDVVSGCPGATETISRIGTQGRKCQVFGLFAGHSWLASRTGGDSAVRDNLTARIVHHMERKQAYVLLQDTELAREAKTLKIGEAYFQTIGRTPARVQIPKCEPADVFKVAEILRKANGGDHFVDINKMPSEQILQVDDSAKKHILPVDFSLNVEKGIEKGIEESIELGKIGGAGSVEKEEELDILGEIKRIIRQPGKTLNGCAKSWKVDAGQLSKLLNGQETLSQRMREKLTSLILVNSTGEKSKVVSILTRKGES